MLFALQSLALLLAEGAGEGKENQPGFSLLQFLPFVLIFVFFYFFIQGFLWHVVNTGTY